VPNFALRAVVDTLRCRCRFSMTEAAPGGNDRDDDHDHGGWVLDANGCPAVLSMGDVAAHEAACGFALLTCGATDRGGRVCGAQTLRRDAAAHAAGCALRAVRCARRCGATHAACDAAAHKAEECPRTLQRCHFFGCHALVRRSEQPRHDAERMADHLAGERQARLAYREGVAATTLGGVGTDAATVESACADARVALRRLLDEDASASVVQAALSALAALLVSAPASTLLPDGACAPVAAAMRAHGAHAGVQASALWCLRFAAPRTRPGDAAAPAAVEALLAAMGAHGAHVGVQHRACAALAVEVPPPPRQVPPPPANSGSLFAPALAAGACTAALLAAARAHAADARLQAVALRALARALAVPDDGAAVAADDAADDANAGDRADAAAQPVAAAAAAAEALRAHPLDVGVAQHACAVLRAATTVARGAEAERARAVVAAAPGAVEALLRALGTHAAHAPLLCNAAGALRMLFTRADAAAAAAAMHAPPACGGGGNGAALLVRALHEQGGGGARSDVAHALLQVIAQLAGHAAGAASFAFKPDCLAIVAALRAHNAADAAAAGGPGGDARRAALTPGYAACALASLVRSVPAWRVRSSLAQAVLAALLAAGGRAAPRASLFHRSVFSLLLHLSTHAQHRARAVNAGALAAVAAAMRQLPRDARVQRDGCDALAALCAPTQPQHAARARADGVLDAVAAAAAAFPDEADGGVAAAAAAAAAAISYMPQPPAAAAAPAAA
jgi:hypothetical protein